MAGVVIKLGGSLFDLPDLDVRVLRVLDSVGAPALIVPGGGRLADCVRQFQHQHPSLSDHAAHDAAFTALSVSARLTASLLKLPLVVEWDREVTAVADPAELLKRAGAYRQLPARWDVTSDSISAAIAHALEIDRVVLLKSTDAPQSLGHAVESGAVDTYFPTLVDGLQIEWCHLRGDLREPSPAVEIKPTHWGGDYGAVTRPESPDGACVARDDLVAQAIRVAAEAHRSQTRRGDNLPYIVHPIEVSRILAYHGFPETLAELHAAALLHDTVEDTELTLAELREKFSSNVADWVEAASEIKLDNAGQKRKWHDRKREHVERLEHAPWQPCAIVLADKIHNLRDILSEPRDAAYWSLFNGEPGDMLEYYRSTLSSCTRGETVALTETLGTLIERFAESLGNAQ